MAFTKDKAVTAININEAGVISYRETVRIYEDGALVAERNNRTSVEPGQPKQGHPKLIRDLIDLIHTPDVISAYQTRQAP